MNVLHRLGWLQFVLLTASSVAGAVESPNSAPTAPAASSVPSVPSASSASSIPAAVPDPEEPLFAAPTSLDRIGRILAPVMVNGRGPFRFVLDTGANYSTVSPLLLNALGLQVAPDQSRLVHGVTGTAYVPTVLIDKLEAGSVTVENAYMPIVESSINLQAHGILGVAGLQEARVYVDFRRDSVVITRARLRREDRGSYFVLDASRVEGGLLAVNATIRGVRAKAIIDTGAQGTLGNLALRNALRAKHRRHPEARLTDVFGATDAVAQGESELTSTLNIGDITISHVDVTYGDFHIFDAWNLKDRPAMLIGMDVLGVADALIIDFRSRQVLVKRADWRELH
jgi:predicted aspartyl protease